MTKKNIIIGVAAIILLVIIGLILRKPKNTNPTSPTLESTEKAVQNITVELKAQDNSTKSAQATLENQEGKTKISLTVPDDADRMAFLRKGTCQNLEGVEYILASPQNGKSETMVDISLEELLKKTPLTISLRKATDPVTSYFFCGEIEK